MPSVLEVLGGAGGIGAGVGDWFHTMSGGGGGLVSCP